MTDPIRLDPAAALPPQPPWLAEGDEPETEAAHQLRRIELREEIRLRGLTYADLSARDAWYLTAGEIDALWRKAIAPERMTCRALGIPLDVDGARAVDTGELRATDALGCVRGWMADMDCGGARCVLMLVGTKGLGKTVAAAWAAVQTGRRAVYIRASDAIKLHMAAFGQERTEWLFALRAPLLIVDEVTGEMHRGRLSAALLEIVDARQRDRTIIISNLREDDFLACFDERARDRLKKVGAVRELSGDSLRTRDSDA